MLVACGRTGYDELAANDGGDACDGGSCEVTATTCGAGGGTRDLSFGTDGTGMVVPSFGASDDVAWAMAVQEDGKLIAAGRTYVTDHNEFAVARFDQDGVPDSTFGTQGQTVVRANHDYGYAVAVQNDGKIIVGGDTWNFGRQDDFTYVRLDDTGAVDADFGMSGVLQIDFGNSDDSGRGIAVAGDGSILIAGTASYDDANADFALVRLDSSGTPDPTFGSEGQVRTDFGTGADGVAAHHRSIEVFPDGSVLIAGRATTSKLEDFALARYTGGGVLDASFDGDGRVVTDFAGENDRAASMAVMPEGKIVVAGYATVQAQRVFALARYDENGNLDTSFGQGGTVVTTLPGGEASISAMGVTASGELVVGGSVGPDGARDLVLARYCSDGTLDDSFGTDGFLVEDLGGGIDAIYDLEVRPGGLVVALAQSDFLEATSRFVLLRYSLE